jgi:hypothetical protein
VVGAEGLAYRVVGSGSLLLRSNSGADVVREDVAILTVVVLKR